MGAGRRSILSAMMALVYATQGAWWPLLAVHLRDLGIEGRMRGAIFATFALGAMVSPPWAGRVADGRVASERLLAGIYALGTAMLAALALGAASGAKALFAAFLAYWLLTAPAYGLAASLALRNLPRPEGQFGGVRLWGTAGWMAAGWLVSAVLAWDGAARGAADAFAVGAGLSALLALLCLRLPHTPPLATGRAAPGWSELHALRGQPGVGVYLATAFGVSLTTPFVYQVLPTYLEHRGLPRSWLPAAMTLGQIPEIVALAALPRLIRRAGYRATLALGVLAWMVRYGMLLPDPPLWMVVAGIPLQGLGIALFTVGGQVFLDSRAPADRRAGAQAVQVMVTSGAGMLLGSLLAGEVAGRTDGGGAFLLPCLINAGLLVYLTSRFRPSVPTPGGGPAPGPVRTPACDGARPACILVEELATESADG